MAVNFSPWLLLLASTAFMASYMLASVSARHPWDCAAIYKKGTRRSGIYPIYPYSYGGHIKTVRCDMQTDGGGWTVIQRRVDGTVDFFRPWEDYKKGFGHNFANHYRHPNPNLWLGLDYIHALTAHGSELRVDLWNWDGRKAYAKYGFFSVGDSGSNYKLRVGSFHGSARDALSYNNGMKFSTRDRDNDRYRGSCARHGHAGWWYKKCSYANLNAPYFSHKVHRGMRAITWWHWNRNWYSLKRVQMMVRPRGFTSG